MDFATTTISYSYASTGLRNVRISKALINNVAGLVYTYGSFLIHAIDNAEEQGRLYPDMDSNAYKKWANGSTKLPAAALRVMKDRTKVLIDGLVKKLKVATKTTRSNGKACASTLESTPFVPMTPLVSLLTDNPRWNLAAYTEVSARDIWMNVVNSDCPNHLKDLLKCEETHSIFESVALPVSKYVLSGLLQGNLTSVQS